MASIDNVKRITYNKSLEAQSFTATANGTGIDTKGAESVVFVADVGTVVGTCTMQVQDSDDNSSYAAIAAGNLTTGAQPTAVTTANDNTTLAIGYKGGRRYVRWAITGAPTSIGLSAAVVLGHLRRAGGTP